MPPVVHRFDPPERFVVGTVGAPGQRTFFLQARDGARLTSVALEKQQVQILAREVDELLDKLIEAGRETCPFCGGPMDPGGHLCPRANGFRRTGT